MIRPDELRETPRFDRSDVPQEWTTKWRFQVVDLFSGRGGVGLSLFDKAPLPIEPRVFAGFDIEDYSDTYPGRFAQADLLDDPSLEGLAEKVGMPPGGYDSIRVPRNVVDDEYGLPVLRGLTADVVWCSFPCQAYSSLSPTYYGSQEAALEANPRITDELRDFLTDIAPHYILENVPRATKIGDLDANVRVNGLAFGKPYDYERHFETTFPVPDAYVNGEPEVTIDTRGDQSVAELADAKGVPAEWGKQGVRSALPPVYVHWILSHCPAVPSLAPKRIDHDLSSFADGVGRHQMWPEIRPS
ncbi:hypothetical protein HLRTI_000502 [Halorhabdus tiamatea SARL4B]|uniref:DNA (cytosine-5-)-methyltransferase n=1 Tax=Halorhabdus tiamatea SARL4B TaxID=1033806 RepID=F7PLQ8_9EURY|nr:hypothetical protein [Halorhabdus tiamatea]ERJ07460.1 hypothetical protein HLRTI_000502 [Halorhabdus tiamatea SARL4B]